MRSVRKVRERRSLNRKGQRTGGSVVWKLLAFPVVFCLLAILPYMGMTVHAERVYENPDTGYVVIIEDDARLLSEMEETELAKVMLPITVYGNVAFKSIDENGYSTKNYIEKYYHEQFGTRSGTVFLIDMDNRNIWIFSDGAVYKVITNSYADTITDNCYRYASKEAYYTCAAEVFAQIYTLLEGNRIAQPMKYISNTLLAMVLALLLNFFVVRRMSKVKYPGKRELKKGIISRYQFSNPNAEYIRTTKTYSPPSSSGGSGGSSGGGGGGSSGGGGGHSF